MIVRVVETIGQSIMTTTIQAMTTMMRDQQVNAILTPVYVVLYERMKSPTTRRDMHRVSKNRTRLLCLITPPKIEQYQ